MFVSIIGEGPLKLEVEPSSDGDGFMVAVPIAQDDDSGRIVILETLLSPATIDEFDFHEISFQISVISLDESFEAFTTQMRDQARQYLPKECIPRILEIVGESCEQLIDCVQPTLIYYVTKETNLPSRALEKYDLLTWYVQGKDYTLYERGTDGMNREFWKLARPLDPSN